MLSMVTSYAIPRLEDPEPHLARIADAGFSHIHWGNLGRRDYLYAPDEIEDIRLMLQKHGLRLLDLHGTNGIEKRWTTTDEAARRAGVELIRNRILLTEALGSDVIVMHIEPHGGDDEYGDVYWKQLFASLDELRPFAMEHGARIAVELGQCDPLDRVLEKYEPEFVGLCYDSGHGNRRPDGPGWLEKRLDRLISIHLHDNDESYDQHRIPFTGTVDWPRVMELIARSPYDKPVSLECEMKFEPYETEEEFLAASFEAGARLTEMLEKLRSQ